MITHNEAMLIEEGLLNHALSIVAAKRNDYSGNQDPLKNLRKSLLFDVNPVDGTLVRITDKLSRIQTLQKQGTSSGQVGEKLIDTLADVINYTALIACLLAEEFPELKQELIEKSNAKPTIPPNKSAPSLNDFIGQLSIQCSGKGESC